MAYEIGILDIPFTAQEDLSDDQYRIVVLNTTYKTVQRPDAGSDIPLGVLQNNPAAGEPAQVRVLGVSKVRAGETIAPGEYIKLEYVSATDAGNALDADVALDKAIGMCVEGGDDGDLITAIITPVPFQVNVAS